MTARDAHHPATGTAAPAVANRLMHTMTRLRSRLQKEAWDELGELPVTGPQFTTLARLAELEPVTTSRLAQAEQLRRQTLSDTLSALRRAGLIEASPDPADSRQTLLRASPEGRELLAVLPRARQAWLSQAMGRLTAGELRTLNAAMILMDRLADS